MPHVITQYDGNNPRGPQPRCVPPVYLTPSPGAHSPASLVPWSAGCGAAGVPDTEAWRNSRRAADSSSRCMPRVITQYDGNNSRSPQPRCVPPIYLTPSPGPHSLASLVPWNAGGGAAGVSDTAGWRNSRRVADSSSRIRLRTAVDVSGGSPHVGSSEAGDEALDIETEMREGLERELTATANPTVGYA